MPNGKLNFDEGLISARLDPLGMIDAAVSGEIAGIELELHPEQGVNIFLGEQSSYRSKLTLSLSMRPHTLERFVYIVAHKVGLTVLKSDAIGFTEVEWRRIRDACDLANASDLAERIRRAYDPARYDDPRGEADR